MLSRVLSSRNENKSYIGERVVTGSTPDGTRPDCAHARGDLPAVREASGTH